MSDKIKISLDDPEIREVWDSLTKWEPIPDPPKCDICHRPAIWRHPAGGQRCGACPRPEK